MRHAAISRALGVLTLVAAALLAQACGQKGPLTLPDESAGASADAPADAAQPNDDEENDAS